MKPAARVGDLHVCPMFNGPIPHVGGPILPPGCPTVLIGGMPAARVTDKATCVGPPDSIIIGSPTVLIGNLMAARIGDNTAHGGAIVMGCPTVLIGDCPPGANGPFAMPDNAAIAAIAAANPQSIADNLEYSGLIYQGADGNYYFTGPARGTDQGANPLVDAPAPMGAKIVG